MHSSSQASPKTASPLKGKRILIAKPGLDGHDVGAKVIALALRDAGADVIYTGLRKSPEYIADVAVDEDVDAVGLSLLSGSHNELVVETMRCLAERDGGDIKVFVGGTIPSDDHPTLKAAGVSGVFTAEMDLDAVVAAIVMELGA
jgi:methylmalonyl-CoA mutase C-terminal domain/subunit